jgi:hypothetical protein
MASGSVKRSVDCSADFSDLQISKMNSFVFSAVTKNDGFLFFIQLFRRETCPQSGKVLLNGIKIGGAVHFFFFFYGFSKYRDTYCIVRSVSQYVSHREANVSLQS